MTEFVKGKVVPQDDVASVASVAESIKPITGKRRRCQVLSDSENCESDAGISQRLRRKTRIIEAAIDTDKGELISQTGAFSCIASIASGTDGSTLLESEPESITKKKKKEKKVINRKRTSPIADKLHPIVDTGRLNDYPTASLVAQTLEWVDIELIRIRSSFQGVISKNVKERLKMIEACFQVLHNLSLGANDST